MSQKTDSNAHYCCGWFRDTVCVFVYCKNLHPHCSAVTQWVSLFSSFTSSFSESLISFFPFFSSSIFCFFSLCSYVFSFLFSFSFASLYSFTFILFFHCPLSFSYLTTPLISFSFLLFSSCLWLFFTVYSNLVYFSFFPSASSSLFRFSFLPLSLSTVPVQCISFTLFKIFHLPFSCLLPKTSPPLCKRLFCSQLHRSDEITSWNLFYKEARRQKNPLGKNI